ncbi:MAG: hypothetical protein ACE5HA_01870 [Anaerolineae bacterium]
MGDRRTRRKRKEKQPEDTQQEPEPSQGWIKPRTAIIIIAVVTLLNAANVFYAYSKSADLTATAVLTLLAFVTPGLAAGLVYFIRRRLAG